MNTGHTIEDIVKAIREAEAEGMDWNTHGDAAWDALSDMPTGALSSIVADIEQREGSIDDEEAAWIQDASLRIQAVLVSVAVERAAPGA